MLLPTFPIFPAPVRSSHIFDTARSVKENIGYILDKKLYHVFDLLPTWDLYDLLINMEELPIREDTGMLAIDVSNVPDFIFSCLFTKRKIPLDIIPAERIRSISRQFKISILSERPDLANKEVFMYGLEFKDILTLVSKYSGRVKLTIDTCQFIEPYEKYYLATYFPANYKHLWDGKYGEPFKLSFREFISLIRSGVTYFKYFDLSLITNRQLVSFLSQERDFKGHLELRALRPKDVSDILRVNTSVISLLPTEFLTEKQREELIDLHPQLKYRLSPKGIEKDSLKRMGVLKNTIDLF